MDEMTDDDWHALSDAIVSWTGHGQSPHPVRDDSTVERQLGGPDTKLRAAFRTLVQEFYASDARLTAVDLQEMGSVAMAEFRARHPRVSEDALQALAWCYTYDFK